MANKRIQDLPSEANPTVWKGPYSDNTAYLAGSIVRYSNKAFIALVDIPGTNTDAPIDGTTWAEFDVGDPTGNTLTFTTERQLELAI